MTWAESWEFSPALPLKRWAEWNLGFGVGVWKVVYLSWSLLIYLIISLILVLFQIGDVVISCRFTEFDRDGSLLEAYMKINLTHQLGWLHRNSARAEGVRELARIRTKGAWGHLKPISFGSGLSKAFTEPSPLLALSMIASTKEEMALCILCFSKVSLCSSDLRIQTCQLG